MAVLLQTRRERLDITQSSASIAMQAPASVVNVLSYYPSSSASGSLLNYSGTDEFSMFDVQRGGWLTLNRGRKGLRRVHRGNEDSSRER